MSDSSLASIRRSLVIPGLATLFLLVSCAKEEATVPAGADAGVASSTIVPIATGSASSAPAEPASRDACSLISAEELKSASGVVATGAKGDSGGAATCTWMGSDGKGVVVQLYPYASRYEGSREAFEEMYKTKSTELPGVGDKAFVLSGKTGPMETATISAVKGSSAVSVQVMSMGGDAATLKKEAVTLTKAVVGKL